MSSIFFWQKTANLTSGQMEVICWETVMVYIHGRTYLPSRLFLTELGRDYFVMLTTKTDCYGTSLCRLRRLCTNTVSLTLEVSLLFARARFSNNRKTEPYDINLISK